MLVGCYPSDRNGGVDITYRHDGNIINDAGRQTEESKDDPDNDTLDETIRAIIEHVLNGYPRPNHTKGQKDVMM